MATNFSPSLWSYVLNQFPSVVTFGMKGFYVSATGAIQGHHGPLVPVSLQYPYVTTKCLSEASLIWATDSNDR